jgi:DMSO/TMAO reductase YedYZ molybdopterin-dependent catalytic subunit
MIKKVYAMKSRLKISALLLISVVLFSGCMSKAASASSDALKKLADAQVTQYNGQKLSSITDLKDVSIKGPQNIDIKTYKLNIDGFVDNPMSLTYDEVLANTHYSKVVTLNCVEGWSAKILWQGVLLKDILDNVKVKAKANTVIFYAADGYTTSLPLQTILDKDMIIAYKINGVVLPAQDGYPFMLVAEDKLGYKWIKWITRIELSSDSSYQGYWESRGYSNEADATN